MRARSSAQPLTLAALGAIILLGATLPAFAARPDEHHERRDDHRDWHRGYAAPPVFVAPPTSGYYAPPPVYNYGPPGVSIGINIP
jgi:hypothetical protein